MRIVKRSLTFIIALVLLLAAALSVSAAGKALANVSISRGGILRWDAFKGAVKYWIAIDSEGGWTSEGETSADLNEWCTFFGMDPGEHTVSLTAYNDKSAAVSDRWTGSYTFYAAPRLQEVGNLRWSGAVAEWDPVPNAQRYSVTLYADNLAVKNDSGVTSTRLDFTGWLYEGTYSYSFEVNAFADGWRTGSVAVSDAKVITYPDDITGHKIVTGDVNVDGEVTNRDAMILDRYIAGWKTYDRQLKSAGAADMNRDGEVTNRDAMILDRYIAGWNGYGKYIVEV